MALSKNFTNSKVAGPNISQMGKFLGGYLDAALSGVFEFSRACDMTSMLEK